GGRVGCCAPGALGHAALLVIDGGSALRTYEGYRYSITSIANGAKPKTVEAELGSSRPQGDSPRMGFPTSRSPDGGAASGAPSRQPWTRQCVGSRLISWRGWRANWRLTSRRT